MSLQKQPVVDFGKFRGKTMDQLPQYYLAWIVGYSGVGSGDITLPREQPEKDKTHFRFSRPEIYFAALNELVKRNQCLACGKQLVSFKATKDWRTRLLHKKCYLEHVDDVYEEGMEID